jgi:sec-independent protein translocase protein TatB
MFDVGFWELVLIGVVALVVVGPERLPRMARVAGLWLGRARRVLGSVKAEIDRELKAEELKEILRKQAESNPLHRIIEEPARPTSKPIAKTTAAVAESGSPARHAAAPDTAPAQSTQAGTTPSAPDPRP